MIRDHDRWAVRKFIRTAVSRVSDGAETICHELDVALDLFILEFFIGKFVNIENTMTRISESVFKFDYKSFRTPSRVDEAVEEL